MLAVRLLRKSLPLCSHFRVLTLQPAVQLQCNGVYKWLPFLQKLELQEDTPL